jgi:hypothetical protein
LSRFPSTPALALLLLVPPAARGEAVLAVSGSVVSIAPRLEVRVVVTNRGDRAAAPLEVTGELLGSRRSARLAEGVSAGGSGAVLLGFDPEVSRPGLHALTLLLEHPVEGLPDAAGNAPLASERAALLLALGANPGPSVRLAAEPLQLDVEGILRVRVESADGAPHRVHLRALTARGLRADGEGAEVDAPATGAVAVSLPLVRAGAPRGSRHAVLLVAESLDGDLARTAVVSAPVEVAADPSVLPRLRGAVFVLGILLIAVAVGFEVRRRNGRR